MTPAFRLVVFDFSGTLAHVRPSTELFFARFLRSHGVPVDAHRLRVDLRRRLRSVAAATVYARAEDLDRFWVDLYRDVLVANGVPERRAASTAEAMLDAHEAADSYELYDDVLATLDALRALPVALGIASNFGRSLRPKLEHLGISGYFEQVTCSVEVGRAKPDAAFFRLLAEAHGVGPDELLYVGDDRDHDLEPCRELGIASVLVDRRPDGRPGQAMPTLAAVVDLLRSPRRRLSEAEPVARRPGP